MLEKKYNKEYCIVLLKEKQKLLQSQGIIFYAYGYMDDGINGRDF